jgi:2-polyprenyl-3-methyl-5-hydroxy-6-metoxy-1,4-benzoquinol methylase
MSNKHVYDYAVDTASDTAAARVVRLVGQRKRVLEVGAGPGSITRVLTHKGKCTVTALEIDAAAIEIVSQHCQRVIKADLNVSTWPELLSGEKFDVVVAADVLEHIYDPLITLRHMKDLLNESGYIVTSIPHVGHSTLQICLFDEDFEYRDWGLLDRTHIRFFGIKNMQSLFENSGLKIIEAQFVVREPENTEFAERWSRAPAELRSVLAKNPFGNVYQVIAKSVPTHFGGVAIDLRSHPVEQSRAYLACDDFESLSSDPGLSVATVSGRHRELLKHCAVASEKIELEAIERHCDESEVASQIPTMRCHSQAMEDGAAMPNRVRVIAFYLPQFHPVPENNLWWGNGFTEWTNVVKAAPLFEGHYQPHLPTDLGLYDLRVRQTRHDQVALAKQYGIDGFCYHYYWFSGKRMLHAPLDDMLADPESAMSFCLCWANENWTRRWDGGNNEVLLEQKYLPEDDENFIKSLIPFFRDQRYIKLDDAPFLVVYRPQDMPNPKKSVTVWRDYCRSLGIKNIHVSAALIRGNQDYKQFGFDSGVEFPPHNVGVQPLQEPMGFYNVFSGIMLKYHEVAQSYLTRHYPDANVFRTVFPSWDNTARVGSSALVVLDGTPSNYEYWLSETIRLTKENCSGPELFVFVNAWNEWAEGCHLEPDRRYGLRFLEATLRAKMGESKITSFEHATCLRSRRRLSTDLLTVSKYHSTVALRRYRLWSSKHPRLERFVKMLRVPPMKQLVKNCLMLVPAVRRYLAEKATLEIARRQAVENSDRYLTELRKQSSEIEAVAIERDTLKREREQAAHELDGQREISKVLSSERDALICEREQVEHELDGQREISKVLSSERDALICERDQVEHELDGQREISKVLSSERDALIHERGRLQEEIDRRSIVVQSLYANLDTNVKARHELCDEISRLRAALEVVEIERDSLSRERDKLQINLDQERSDKETIAQERDELTRSCIRTQLEFEKLESERNWLREERQTFQPAVLGSLTILRGACASLTHLSQVSEKVTAQELSRGYYLNLLEDALTGILFKDESIAPGQQGYDEQRRELGRDWPRFAFTMIGKARMRNLREAVQTILRENVQGDLLEAGVWRGGACIYMRGILKAYGETSRRVWVADSFAGLPPPDSKKYPPDKGDIYHTFNELVVPVEQVRANFESYGLLDEQVKFLKGWFKDSLRRAPVRQLALLRLDADMYESTIQILEAMYWRVSPGGFVIVDDYILAGCREAVHDFRDQHNIQSQLMKVDGTATYWRKPSNEKFAEPLEVFSQRGRRRSARS